MEKDNLRSLPSKETIFEIEGPTPFSESHIWQLNRDFYQKEGLDAWRDGRVPHHLTSHSKIGKTYAELIFGFLQDLFYQGKNKETVYILELGAGHGRLAYHTIKHLNRLIGQVTIDLPPFCFILSDIIEESLQFFLDHPQFKEFFNKGTLDVAYFDAVESKEIDLRIAHKKLQKNDLQQPILVLANYFFDSIPCDLFLLKKGRITNFDLALQSTVDPEKVKAAELLKHIQFDYTPNPRQAPFFEEPFLNEILGTYKSLLFNTFLMFPSIGIRCLENLKDLSGSGLLLLSMDKGSQEIHDLENKPLPDMVTHGSMSFAVNFHSLGEHCKRHGGQSLFSSQSSFHVEVACLAYLTGFDAYINTKLAFQRYVNDFGPDDLNSLKKFSYKHIKTESTQEIIGLLRIFAYDSTLFKNVMPRLKQVLTRVTFNERRRVAQTLHQVWEMYFALDDYDMAFEIGGLFYMLGFYEEALVYFKHSENLFGNTTDVYYNRILAYYQLRQDKLFVKVLAEAKAAFPDFKRFDELDKLDLGAS